jgi:hypothetical protein
MTMLTPAWAPLRYHPDQARLWRSTVRFKAVVAGRGSGKTELSRRKVVRHLPLVKPWASPMYFYALPTRDQAKRVAWPVLKALVPPSWLARNGISESELTITTVFGSTLHLLGMDKPARAEGVQWDGGIVDECCDQRPGLFDLTLRPALSHKTGWCDRIGVPKRAGPGAQEFKAFFERGLSGSDPEVESYSWPSSDILTAAEIESARRQLDEKDYNEQYCASWETVGGAVFYAFSEVLNVDSTLAYRKDTPLLVGCDFNVDPMAWVFCQAAGRELHVLDELWMRNTNTEAALAEVKRRYGDHPAGLFFFGDATGKARKTAASTSDYVQIRNFVGLGADRRVFFPDANPARHDRFAACNAMFKNAADERRCRVHPRCRNLVKDLLARAYEPGTSEPDDHGDVSHASDALGYLVNWLYPLAVAASETPPNVPLL